MVFFAKTKRLIGFLLLFPCWIFGQQCGSLPEIQLGEDTVLCNGQTVQLDVSSYSGYDHYTWGNGSTSSIITISSAGTYSIKATSVGNNLVKNGDFSQGDTEFTTEYTIGTGGSYGQLSLPGTYAISTSPGNVHQNFSYCSDHTGNNGNMMVVNGAASSGKKVWCQTIPVTQNTTYEFSTWVLNNLNDPNVAKLQFTINGNTLGNIFSPPTSACNWSQFYEQWNSGLQTSAKICITNNNILDAGNDFSIDDIYFAPVCNSFDTIEISYLNYPQFTLPTSYNSCDGDTLTLNAENSGMSFLWNNTDADTTQKIDITQTGTYKVTVSNEGRCQKDRIFNVDFHTPPNAGKDSLLRFCNTEQSVQLFSLLPQNISTSGTWLDSNSQFINNTVSIVNQVGSLQFQYVVYQQYCPADTAVYTLDIQQYVDAGQSYTDHLCNIGSINLTNHITGGGNGKWNSVTNFATPHFDTISGVLDLNQITKGDYMFQYIIENESPCPSDTAFFTIKISESPKVKFIADTTEGCSPLSIKFNDLTEVNGTKEWQWSIDGEVVDNSPSFTYTFEDHTSYDIGLKVTVDQLCTMDTVYHKYITVNPDPIANFEYMPNQVFSNNPVVHFKNTSSLNNTNYWDFSGLSSSTEENPKFTFPLGVQKTYTVYLKVSSLKNCVDSIAIAIPVKTHTLFFIPNAFSPDNDEYNNIFKPVMSVNVDPQNYTFSVYNRWGELLFVSHNFNIGWDGSYDNKIMPSGVYIWKLAFKELSSGKVVRKTGTITLIR